MSLAQYKKNRYSQFGEDGIVEEIFGRIGFMSQVCVEFGAADGLHCSNTAKLWRDEQWSAVLIEADPSWYNALDSNTRDYAVTTVRSKITPTGLTSVDLLLKSVGVPEVDFMSIDVDGDDYAIWERMNTRPRVVCIEYNQSVPPHLDLRQAELGDSFGASALSLMLLGESKGYDLVGMTRCNLLFVDEAESGRFNERGLDDFDHSALTYVVSDPQSRIAMVGTPPWGWGTDPYLGETVGEVRRMPQGLDLWRAYEKVYGPGRFVSRGILNVIDLRPEARAEHRLRLVLGPRLIGIDISHVSADEAELVEWVKPFTAGHGYRYRMDPGLITLIKE